MIFLRPIGNGFHHKFAKHISFRSGVIAASAGRRIGTRIRISVIIIRNDFIKGAVCIIGMIVNHIHNNTDSRLMECLYHLLEFTDSDLSVIRIGSITALGNVIILGIVAPVKARIGITLVHGRIIVYGKKMHMRNTKRLQIIHTNRNTILIYKSCFRKRKIFTFIL